MPKTGVTSGQFDIYSQMSGQLDIWKNVIEQAANSQMYPTVEASSAQDSYYIRSAWHLQSDVRSADIWKNAIEQAGNRQMYPPVEASGGQQWY